MLRGDDLAKWLVHAVDLEPEEAKYLLDKKVTSGKLLLETRGLKTFLKEDCELDSPGVVQRICNAIEKLKGSHRSLHSCIMCPFTTLLMICTVPCLLCVRPRGYYGGRR